MSDSQNAYELFSNLDEDQKTELVKLTSDLISFPNVSPPGRNSRPVQEYIKEYLKKLNFSIIEWEEYEGDPNIVAVKRGSDSINYHNLILNNHVDVAEVGDTSGWSNDPFKAIIKGNRLLGRGASDMKSGLAACLYALKLLRDKGVNLKGDLIFHSVTGEEAGEGITSQCLQHAPKGDFAIVADTSEMKIQGQGGVITGWITIQSPKTYHDGVRNKMIHAGGGVFGASAIEKMMKVIQGLQDLERHWAVTKVYEGFSPGSNTINPAVIEGGRHAAFVADRCALWITVHFYPDEDYEQVCNEIETQVLNIAKSDPWLSQNPPTFNWGGKSMLIDRGEVFPSLEIDIMSDPVKLLTETHSFVVGNEPEIGMSPTVSDAGWLGRANIPTVIYGPGELSHAHAVDESIPLKQLFDYTLVLANFIAKWCNSER